MNKRTVKMIVITMVVIINFTIAYFLVKDVAKKSYIEGFNDGYDFCEETFIND